MFFEKYINLVLGKPFTVLLSVFLLTLFLGWNAQQFRMDASADSLVVEGDADLEYSRVINSRYGAGDFVFVTYAPNLGLFTPPSLTRLKALKNELEQITNVESVDSIFDVPLFKAANVSLSEITDNIITLEFAGVDLSAASDDLMSSDAYRNVLLSEDGLTTALIVNFTPDTALASLLEERSALRELDRASQLTANQAIRHEEVEALSTAARVSAANQLHKDIADIRIILEKYRDNATIYLGGVPMIADDLVTFVRNDLFTFGAAILFFIIASLAYLFRKARYVAIPLLCGAAIAICVIGLLGLMDWAVTVISSNFISLLLIITVSLTVHLIVRFRELEVEQASLNHHERLKLTLQSMIKPCAYTSLTTIVAFGSLVISDIPPIIDFGWMMVMGVCCAFLLTFLIFPAVLGLLPESSSRVMQKSINITPSIGRFTQSNGPYILLVAGLLFVLSIIGISRLQVENSFIDYFDDSTEIYQGMVAIDQNMGGTTPLDVIIDMRPPNPDEEAYWFTSDKMQEIIAIHDYLDAMPETGKVLSLATLLNIAYELNEDEPLNSIELAVLYNKIPDSYKESLLKPYVSVVNDQIRFSIRVLETSEGLVRADLLEKIRQGLSDEFGYSGEQVHLTGMLVLYNNMLQSLFESQILTLGMVLLVITAMFLVLFRSWKLALIGIIPNILAALSVLGLMGWLGIPLDMMTITIAAISVGIGVDNTIHYMHRYKSRFPEFNNYVETMTYCHGSIGKAIVAGFSILILSNFIPTIYFGLLTSLAMCLALTGALTLLPHLLIIFKPFKEKAPL